MANFAAIDRSGQSSHILPRFIVVTFSLHAVIFMGTELGTVIKLPNGKMPFSHNLKTVPARKGIITMADGLPDT